MMPSLNRLLGIYFHRQYRSLAIISLAINLGCLFLAPLTALSNQTTTQPAPSTTNQLSQQKANFVRKVKLVKTLIGHSDAIMAGTISPNSKIFASASNDATVKLWDLEMGKLLHTLPRFRGSIAIAFSPDGTLLASDSDSDYRKINIWDVKTGQLLRTLERIDGSSTAFYFSPDGRQLKSSNALGTIEVWDLKTQKPLQVLTLPDYPENLSFMSPTFSPDGKVFGVGLYSEGLGAQPVKFWDAVTNNIITVAPAENRCNSSFTFSTAFSPDGRSLAIGMANKQPNGNVEQKICVWDVQTRKLHHVLLGHTMGIWGLAFTPNSQLLASGSADGTIRLWDLTSGTQQMMLTQKLDEITGVVFSPDGKKLVSWGISKTIKVWQLE
jgi:WD40 repeat protein